MSKDDFLELEGVVVDILRDDIKIQLQNGHIITGYLAGKLRINNIRILIGDKVKVEMSPYDLNHSAAEGCDPDADRKAVLFLL